MDYLVITITYRFQVTAAKDSGSSLISFIGSIFCGRSLTACCNFPGLRDHYRGIVFFDYVRVSWNVYNMFFEVGRNSTFDISQVCQAFRRTVEFDWNSEGSVW